MFYSASTGVPFYNYNGANLLYSQGNGNQKFVNRQIPVSSADNILNKNNMIQKRKTNQAEHIIWGTVSAATILCLLTELLSKGKKLPSNLIRLAENRVAYNVVKRKNLTFNRLREDINSTVSKYKLKKGDAVYAIKPSNLSRNSIFGNLSLNKDAVALVNEKGDIYKILDAKSLDDDIKLLFGKNPQVRIDI